MRSKIRLVVIAVAVMGASSTAIAKGGGGGGSHAGMHSGIFMRGHGHHHFQFNRFHRNFVNRFNGNGGWGWGGDWGLGGYGSSGYSNTNVIVYPQATPLFATGSVGATPCHWNTDSFTVPSSAGGSRSVEVVSCR